MTSFNYEKNRLLDTKVNFWRNVNKYYKFNIIRRFSILLRFINTFKRTLDFGPFLMDRLFKDSDLIKLEFTDDLNDHQKAINDCSLNVKNQIKEIANKLATISKDISRRSEVKSISREEEQNLDSAIAMAKELASQSMMDFQFKSINKIKNSNENTIESSPESLKPPKSIKKRFSFKFKNGGKVERKSFTEQAETISDIQSILTNEAIEAYNCLIGRREDRGIVKEVADTKKTDMNPINSSSSTSSLTSSLTSSSSYLPALSAIDINTTSITATFITSHHEINLDSNEQRQSRLVHNELPLPPRSRPVQRCILKQHQRRHPLIIPNHNNELEIFIKQSNP